METVKTLGLLDSNIKIGKFASYKHVDARVQTKSNTATVIEGQITHIGWVQSDP